MTTRTLVKIQPLQWLGLFALVGMAIIFIKLAMAIASFTPRDQPVGYVAQDEISNFNLTSGSETVYRPSYEQEFWSGNLHSYPIDATGNVNTSSERWDGGAAFSLSQQTFDSGRLIATLKDDGSKVPFRSASLSVTQQGYLTGTINLTAYTSTQIVNFLRGDRSNEAAMGMRLRSAGMAGTGGPVLGDIVHCRPFYVADATNPTIFVGANDGMLHAISTVTGAERWAYVPSMLLSKMIALAKPYGSVSNPHDYFVDGQINIGTLSTGTDLLIGALGAGGRGLYALNISSLAATTESDVANKILWEINGTTDKVNYAASTGDYTNLGYTYGTPLITKVNSGGTDAVIVGNGYNDNAVGNYRAYLYVINASTGALIGKVATDTQGTVASPNGLFNPVAVDTNNDGRADAAYAGDLYGRVWKFDLSSGTASSWSGSLLYDTGTGQPIVATPGVALHPDGGYMVSFSTGAMFTDAKNDTTTHYVYGIWDGAPAGNTSLITQTLEERAYNSTRVRRISTTNAPNWASGGNKGWRVALPAGERIAGEGSFIENGRFYFGSHNPTVSTLVAGASVASAAVTAGGSGYSTATLAFSGGGGTGATGRPIISSGSGSISGLVITNSGTGYTSAPTVTITGNGTGATATAALTTGTTVYGENWLMELDYLSGGSKNDPFLDLDGNLLLNSNDRIKYTASDTLPTTSPATVVGDPILDTKGIPVGKWLSNGVQSQPILVQLQTLNTTLFNQNPNVTFPSTAVDLGVSGGHFDEEIFFGTGTGTKATATITVSNAGSGAFTLGDISVDGVTIVPALTTSDIPDGTATSTNATTINNKVAGGFTASKSGNVITITAPTAVTSYNGKTFSITHGTTRGSSVSASGIRPTGLISFSGGTTSSSQDAKINRTLSSNTKTITVGSTTASIANPLTIGKSKAPAEVASIVASSIGTGESIQAYVGGNSVTSLCASQPNTVVCLVDTTTYSNGLSVNLGGVSRFNTVDYTTTPTAGGVAVGGTIPGWGDFFTALATTAFSGGLEPSPGDPCTTCNYDVHIHQYDDKYDKTGVNMLNASSTNLNLVNAIPLTTTQFKVLAQNQYLNPAVKIHIGDPSYFPNVDAGYKQIKNFVTSATLDLATLPTYTRANIGSLVMNMPVDALTPKDWWGNGDVRVGLHPVKPQCVRNSVGTTDGNMYRPIIPPVNGVDGPGTAGWNASTTPATATGARHGGALVIQIIAASTPNSAIEQNVSGRPEYGWRVKSAEFANYVLAEYTTFWHHPNNLCYNDTGWTKSPPTDDSSTTYTPPASGSTDPKIGNLSGSGGGTVTNVAMVVAGNVTTTTITYSTGKTATITRTANADGTITVVTRNADCVTEGAGCTGITETIAATGGSIKTGGDERGSQARTGRISWHELIRN